MSNEENDNDKGVNIELGSIGNSFQATESLGSLGSGFQDTERLGNLETNASNTSHPFDLSNTFANVRDFVGESATVNAMATHVFDTTEGLANITTQDIQDGAKIALEALSEVPNIFSDLGDSLFGNLFTAENAEPVSVKEPLNLGSLSNNLSFDIGSLIDTVAGDLLGLNTEISMQGDKNTVESENSENTFTPAVKVDAVIP